MTTTPRPTATPSTDRRTGTVFAAATGVGVGLGMSLSFLLLALTGWPFGVAMAVGLPSAMIAALLVAAMIVRRGPAPR
jgi:hypothetical protein